MKVLQSGPLQYSIGRTDRGLGWILMLPTGEVLASGTASSIRKATIDLCTAITDYLVGRR